MRKETLEKAFYVAAFGGFMTLMKTPTQDLWWHGLTWGVVAIVMDYVLNKKEE